ncbi:MAG: outer membrane beta-barrel protein [Prevotella sp.]|nr:outer membrane beta-barrel protein [Prevotella sp.]
MRRLFPIILLMMTMTTVMAQDDVEYKMEVGGGIGLLNYQGDFNGSLTKGFQPMGSAVLRRVFNPYMGLRANLGVGKIKGSSKDADTYYPGMDVTPYKFDNLLVDLSVVYECNFWPYGTGRDYRGAKRLTPYVFAGLGGTFVNGDEKNVFTANVPFGIGVKYKIGDRTNLGVSYAIHLSMSDMLDGCKDPYGIESSGLFKNTDCYGMLQLTFTYSFMAKCRTCHNDDY